MLKRLIALILIILPGILEAQTVTGSWYGRADVSHDTRADNYLTELILKQKGNEVEGIFGYYFKDSYESFFIRGMIMCSRNFSDKLKIKNYQII